MSLIKILKSILQKLGVIADYVVEDVPIGVLGEDVFQWGYRKWASGRLEITTSVYTSFSFEEGASYVWYRDYTWGEMPDNIPIKTFLYAKASFISMLKVDAIVGGYDSATRKIKYSVYSGASNYTAKRMRLTLEIEATWK